MTHSSTTLRICELNDVLRTTWLTGQVVITPGITSLPQKDQSAIAEKVQTFSDFSEDNDPHGEHDFGAFEHNGNRIFWKIDYYDQALKYGSEDPANPSITRRVLTIMLANEY